MSSETIKDLILQTPDLNAERVAKLKELFPDLFTGEGQLNEDELRKLVDPQSVNETERYEFRWFGKSQAKRDAFTPSKATLVFDEGRNVNQQIAENLMIEGENLEVLKLLLCAYREEIKCIYIDPPYNTGNDFVYSDNYTEGRKPYWEQTGVTENGARVDTNAETDGRFHSNWMNMMYSRLLVARQLLKLDGVIFISIDDNEVHNLRKLMNEIFGEENYLASFVWRTEGNFDNQAKVKKCHEYILAYTKSIDSFPPPPVIDPSIPESSKLFREIIRNTIVKNGRKNPVSKITLPIGFPADFKDGVIKKRSKGFPHYLNDAVIKDYLLVNETVISSGWSSKDLLLEYIDSGFKPITDSKAQETTFTITQTGAIEIIKKRSDTQSHVISVLTNLGSTQAASAVLESMNIYIDYPKPVELLKYLIRMVSGDDFIVLDFFAGSGSMGDAVMELNKGGGNRKFILVQLPELIDEEDEAYKAGYKKISDITIERNKRVVERLITEKKQAHPNLFENVNDTDALKGLGFKVLRLEKSYFPRADWSPDPSLSEEENVSALKQYIAEKEAQLNLSFDRDKLLTEILLKEEGFKLNYNVEPYKAVVSNEVLHVTDGEKEALICLDPTLELKTVQHFKTHTELKFICLERALDTTKKWNLHHFLGEKFKAI